MPLMIFDARLNANNDLDFSKINTVTGLEKVRQQVFVRLRLFRAEWDYDPTIGVPYFGEILGNRNPDILRIFDILLSEIEKIPDVTGANVLDFDFIAKTLSVTLSVNSTFGNITLTHSILN